jgi:Fe-S-cluster containining protein
MIEPSLRSIDDVGLRLPQGLSEEMAAPFMDYVVMKAAALRGAAMNGAGPAVAVGPNPWVRLKFMVDVMTTGLLPQADATVAEFAAADAKIQCRSGCTFCCHQNVDVTIPEAILVALRLGDEADPRRAATLEAAEMFTGLDDEARIATGRPCPMLVSERCSVYEVRPLACRSFTSPDAANCQTALDSLKGGKGVIRADVYAVLQFLCNGEQAATLGICRDLGLQAAIVDLTQTVAAIIRDPKLIERWAAGEQVFTARL